MVKPFLPHMPHIRIVARSYGWSGQTILTTHATHQDCSKELGLGWSKPFLLHMPHIRLVARRVEVVNHSYHTYIPHIRLVARRVGVISRPLSPRGGLLLTRLKISLAPYSLDGRIMASPCIATSSGIVMGFSLYTCIQYVLLADFIAPSAPFSCHSLLLVFARSPIGP